MLFCSGAFPRRRMFVKTQGSSWLDFSRENLFFFSIKEITNSFPKSIRTTFIPFMYLVFLSYHVGFHFGLLSLYHTLQQWKLFHSDYAESNCKTPVPFLFDVWSGVCVVEMCLFKLNACRRGNLHAPVASSRSTTAQEKVLGSSQVFHCKSLWRTENKAVDWPATIYLPFFFSVRFPFGLRAWRRGRECEKDSHQHIKAPNHWECSPLK